MAQVESILTLDLDKMETPCFIVDEALIEDNLRILQSVIDRTDCKILLALKGYAMFATFPQIARVLHGTCASSVHEARLGFEEFGGEVHAYAAAWSDADFEELCNFAGHIDFNSFNQWRHFKPRALEWKKKRGLSFGIRINPEHSEGTTPIYDPCAPFSRLGVTRNHFEADELEGISYLHFHNLCQQNADSLARTLAVVEEKFGAFIPRMDYVNFGGGHHITRPDYDVDMLVETINGFKTRYPGVQVVLEPGEAIALNAGFLVSTVLDVTENGMDLAILDTSAAAHMPDVLEMPYRPHIIGSGMPGEKPHTYRLGGMSCLAGDVIGDYSFDATLSRGEKLIFTDMAIYSMVKTNTFNGLKLPDIRLYNSKTGHMKLVKSFGYQDFKERLS